MEINKKSQDFILMEKYFKDIKEKNNVEENLNNISRIISRNFDLELNLSIIDNDTNLFFGMNIYPEESVIDNLLKNILEEKSHLDNIMAIWNRNDNKWYVEIDSILLYDNNLNANPSEIVAVLLHEIGHVIYSNSIPEKINRILKYNIMNLTYSIKQLCKNYKFRKIFSLVIVEACSSKNYHYINNNIERIADNFVVKMGYGDELDNFINKLISSQGNRLVNRSDEEIDKDIKVIVKWGIENISELEMRKHKLRESLKVQLLRTPSKYIKDLVMDIKDKFFGDESQKYKTAITEQYLIDEYHKILQESILDFFDSLGKVKKVNNSDIDILSIEVNKIENNDDKIYVLDLLYDKLDIINAALDYIDQGKTDKVSQSKQTLLSMKDRLEKLRQQILNMTIKDKQYGVFIKYPKGYEG
jgi:hypothetical protein